MLRATLRLALVPLALLLATMPARAEPKLKAVATFSILADLVGEVGGDRVAVRSLVGPDADAHGYSPAPDDARALAQADIVFVNGLGFEGWIDRLITASRAKAPIIVVSKAVPAIAVSGDHDHGHGGHDHGDHDHDHGNTADPHAWQNIANAKLYVAAIRDGLARVDPEGAALYGANAGSYLTKLDALEAEVRAAMAAIPPDRRRVITSHASFGYFSAAYGLRFLAPQGLSSASEPGPADIARLIRQIRTDKIPAIFLESTADPRLMRQIARESGARIGGKVYSDALSPPDGPAPSYIEMMRSNLKAFREALS